MKMKSPVLVVSISLACLFTVFHSCHGIRCYNCQSRNFGEENCEKISDDKYLIDYGDEMIHCMKVILNDKVKEIRTLTRTGHTDEGRKIVNDMVRKFKLDGYDVYSFACQEDKCNGL